MADSSSHTEEDVVMEFQKPNSDSPEETQPASPSFSSTPNVRKGKNVQVIMPRELSQAAVVSFVFGAIQLVVTIFYTSAMYFLMKILPIMSASESASNSLPEQQNMIFLSLLNVAGILGFVFALIALTSIRAGKAGGWLIFGGALLSVLCLMIAFIPIFAPVLGL